MRARPVVFLLLWLVGTQPSWAAPSPSQSLARAPAASVAEEEARLKEEEQASVQAQSSQQGELTLESEQPRSAPTEAPASPMVSEAPKDPVALDLGPEEDAARNGIFRRPPGPVQGGVLQVPHPDAAKGLIRINKDGSYQYRVPLRPKSQAISIRMGMMTPPNIEGSSAEVTFKTMYGDHNVLALSGEYEWDPFQKYGAWGIQFGGGFATAHGSGFLQDESTGGVGRSQEAYDLYMLPLSAFLIYRFEYVRRQWVVPFVNGGGTYYGLIEKRDDGAPLKFAGAAAVGGGGGIHFSVSRLDAASAFALDREYGIADMWFTIEGRVMQGLKPDIDFTSEMITAGITVDF